MTPAGDNGSQELPKPETSPTSGKTAERELSLEIFQYFRWSFPLLFVLLAAVNFDSLTAPPFWDDLIGVQTQAVFLARNNLSLSALLNAPRGDGAACYYLLSIPSWIYAVLYLFLPPAAVHFTGHLFSCALLAASGGLFLELTRRKLTPEIAVCGVVSALTHPLLAARAASMDQETWLAFAVMLTLFFWNRHRKRAALVCSGCSLAVKLTGAILVFGIFAKHLEILLRTRNRKRILLHPRLFFGVIAIFYVANFFSV